MVVKYKIIITEDIFELEILVNSAIKEGWEPKGGVFVQNKAYGQAMTLSE